MRLLILILLISSSNVVFGQDAHRKGNIYGLWGYNRSIYAPSDIKFEGQDYNFVLYDAKAVDFPSEFNPSVYFGLFTFTIPQYNYRVGYFVTNDISVSIGLDHMKYVLVSDQRVLMDGVIGSSYQNHSGHYDDVEVPLETTLVTLEHTDGFNYASIELDKHWLMWRHTNGKHFADWYFGGGIGLMIPRSDVTVLGEAAANEFHIAGEAISIQTGFKSTFCKHIYISGTLKAGLSRLHNILTTQSRAKAKQNIGWLQGYWQVGYIGNLKWKRNKSTQ
jgi:hypothetical protein